MKSDVFQFKHFKVSHSKSSMKVGVDGVLIGAWSGQREGKILDIGTGCGLIAMILAQRFPHSAIEGIDIDASSVEEAAINFRNSPWSSNLEATLSVFPIETIARGRRYDLIVSNPPFYNSGVKNPATTRERARHQDLLSIFSLMDNADELLEEGGRLAFIFPVEDYDNALKYASDRNLNLQRECFVRDNPNRPEKRVMIEFAKETTGIIETQHLVMFENGLPTEEYKKLCGDLYLKF